MEVELSMNIWSRWLAISLTLLAALATSVNAQTQTLFRADDGTAYQLLRAPSPLGSNAEHVVFTSVGGSASGVGSCVGIGSVSGDPVSAVGGANPAAMQSLHPYHQIVRTAILVPDDIDIANFDQHFGGRVTLGIDNVDCTGSGAPDPCCTGNGTGTCTALNICKDAFDCNGHTGVQATTGLASATGGVPAACIANGVAAGCEIPLTRSVFAFGLAATGDPPVCTTPADVTVNSMICNQDPSNTGTANGFKVDIGQAILFIYDSSLAGSGFTTAYGGFLIRDAFGTNDTCAMDEVSRIVASAAENKSSAVGLPTETPTTTPTNTATLTPTATASATQTNTPTATLTATSTSTPSSTATVTNTATATSTQTPTPPPTNTRPPIPVVPSPTSPAGMVMIGALGIGLLWALRRLSRSGV
jgi:hypothetical protein